MARGRFENRHDRAMPITEFVEYFTSFWIWKMLIVLILLRYELLSTQTEHFNVFKMRKE